MKRIKQYEMTFFILSTIGFLMASLPAHAQNFFTGNYAAIPGNNETTGTAVIEREIVCTDPDDCLGTEITDRPVVVSRAGGLLYAGGLVNIPEGGSCRFTVDVFLAHNCRLIPFANFTTDPVSESGVVLVEVDPSQLPTGNYSGRARNDCDSSRTACINIVVTN